MCIKGVADYLDSKGPLPFVLSQPFAPSPEIKFTKKEITDTSIVIEYSLTPGQGEKHGSLYVALPHAFQNAKIKLLSTVPYKCCFVNKNELGGVVSSATEYVVLLYTGSIDFSESDVTIEIVPGSNGVTFNGTAIV